MSEKIQRFRNEITHTASEFSTHQQSVWLEKNNEILEQKEQIIKITTSTNQDFTTKINELDSLIHLQQSYFQNMREEGRQRENELKSFNYSVSHDLKAPLNVAAKFLEYLQHDSVQLLTPDSQAHLHSIQGSIEKMQSMISRLRDYSMAENDDLFISTIHLYSFLKDIISDFRLIYPEPHFELAMDKELIIQGDRVLLRTVFENLMDNACKATRQKESAVIQISAQLHQKETIISITDNGLGFLPDSQKVMFKLFKSLHSKSEFEGTGIGLAIVKRIVERHKGNVVAQSNGVAAGATFSIRLGA